MLNIKLGFGKPSLGLLGNIGLNMTDGRKLLKDALTTEAIFFSVSLLEDSAGHYSCFQYLEPLLVMERDLLST